MNNAKTKIKESLNYQNVGFIIFVIVALSLSWSTIKVIQKNYNLAQEINELSAEVENLKLENENLKLGIAYFNTEGFLSREAKKRFNKVSPGEKVIVLPKDNDVDDIKPPAPAPIKSAQDSNFDKWMDFLMGREPI